MAENADLVNIAVTGAVWVAPTTETAPASADEDLTLGNWVNVGYISEDGVTEGYSVDTDEITAWQNSDVVRKTVTGVEITYGFTMIETNAASLSLYYGKSISGGATDHKIGGAGLVKNSFVIDAVDPSSGQTIRRYIPSGEVTERGEVSIAATDAVGYEVTITAYPSPALSGDAVNVWYGTALA